jgi:hypothetical protein
LPGFRLWDPGSGKTCPWQPSGFAPSPTLGCDGGLFALVSDEIQAVVDVYAYCEEAEADLRDVLEDEPNWADVLRVEAFEFETSPN